MGNFNPMQMIQAFMQFNQNFHGDARAEVQQLVASGRINQRQLNKLQNTATQFQNMMNMINKLNK